MSQVHPLPRLQLAPPARRARVLGGHPWVYINELAPVSVEPAAENADAATLFDQRGRALGSGVYNPRSQIAWRRYSRVADRPFDGEFLREAINAAIDRRAEETVRRLVWSDADHVPGLIVDQFEDVLVVQIVTAACEARRDEIAAILGERLGPREILFRADAPVRKLEGLPEYVDTRSGQPLPPRPFEIDGLVYELDLANAQKTGFYLDQREQHGLVASLCEGRSVLDGFCNQGAFSLQAMAAGAVRAVAVDSVAACCEAVRANAGRNDLAVEVEQANMFDYLSALKPGVFDCIILDPPSFARNKKAVPGALRGYKEINLRALRALPPGGILATYGCSQHVDAETFEKVVIEAAGDAGRDIRLFARTGQPFDHPVLLNFPESDYLKGIIVMVE